ncbi:hypothetical protein [Moraxella nasicaprae]|uniref:Lipoprotein n=1 Tax=Moraxella nasicaprae TaxID=2904122 RepID=A0ABY6F365_9GAMM|nr:hypothetical protein [Moraxella nasicaprae]UXZ04529.1 hypothetical protein LU297_08075 [Moraxella nasicaprae]
MKFTKMIAMTTIAGLMLQGCATSYLNSKTRGSVESVERDNVRYMLSYVSANGVQDSNYMVILGDKYTYELDDRNAGGRKLQDLNKIGQVLDLKAFKPKPIRFKLEDSFGGRIVPVHYVFFEFSYDKQGQPLNAGEKEFLNRYCYTHLPNPYGNCEMKFEMKMYAKSTIPNAKLQPVKGNYPIEIVSYHDNKVARTALKPFAFVADVITAPIQLAAGALFMGSIAVGCGTGDGCQ